ncbi:MAG: DUF3149 domain-containing protein [Rhodocyclaceae bacterium]|nr:DUF3149 domain-containing protein [Rhodocyclaceae bacterium]
MAWKELFSTDIGLLSLFTIGFVVVMAFYLIGFIKRKVEEDTRQAK